MSQESPPSQPASQETKHRRWWVAGALLVVAAAVALLPQLPAGREWLLSRALTAAHNAGYDLSYQASRGNPWTGVDLRGVRLRGHGLDLEFQELELRYFLPSLITGELPLSVRASEVTGRADLSALRPAPAKKGSSRGRAGGGGGISIPVRPALRRVDVAGLAVDLENAPYTLPKMDLRGVEVSDMAGGLRLQGTVVTNEGSAELDARMQFSPFVIRAEVSRADLTLGRHWWPHVSGGSMQGSVTITSRDARADLQVSAGVAQVAGIALTDITGGVHYDHPRIDASLTGRALGGPVAATGRVDIAARQWRADVDGNAGLAEAAAWLAEGRLPLEESQLPVSGRADVTVALSGWQKVYVDGRARGGGKLLNQALTDLIAEFSVHPARGTSVTAKARYGGRPLTFDMSPGVGGRGFRMQAAGDDLPLIGGLHGDLRLQVDGDRTTTGQAGLVVDGSLFGHRLDLQVESSLNGDGLRFFVDGVAERRTAIEGAAVWQRGSLEGEVRAEGVTVPGLNGPVNLSVTGRGALDALALSAKVAADNPRYLTVRGVSIINDMRGRLRATWTGDALLDIRARLGGLQVAGGLRTGQGASALDFSLAPSPLQSLAPGGPSLGTLALEGGRLAQADGVWSLQTILQAGPLSLPGINLPVLRGPLEATFGTDLQAAFHDDAQGLKAHYQAGRLALGIDGLHVKMGGIPAQLTGQANLETPAPLETLSFDLQASANQGEVRSHGDGNSAELELVLRPGLDLGPLTLQEGVQLTGELSVLQRTLGLRGTLGSLGLDAQGSLDAGALDIGLTLRAGDDRLRLAAAGLPGRLGWSAAGSLPAGAVAAPFGLALDGMLRADLTARPGVYHGRAELDGEFRGQSFQAAVLGQGKALGLQAQTEILGQPVQATGVVLPNLETNVLVGELGQVALTGSATSLHLEGQGTMPGMERAGFRLAAQPWKLSGDTAAGTARLAVGDTQLQAKRTERGWAWQGEVVQDFQVRGLSATLRAHLSGDSAQPRTSVSGALHLQGMDQNASLPVSGDLGTLKISGTLPADLAGAMASLGALDLRGNVALDATLQWLAGPSYRAELRWKDQATLLEATLQGDRSGPRIKVTSAGLQASYQAGALQLHADGFDLLNLTEQPAGTLLAAGTLARDAQDGWVGVLRFTSPLLPDASLTLKGAGPTLDASGTLQRDDLSAELAGSLLPVLDLQAHARAFGKVALEGRIAGNLGKPHFGGSLTWNDFVVAGPLGLRLPAGQLRAQASLAGGLQLSLAPQAASGPEADGIHLTEGVWSGALTLPFSLGNQHQTLRLEPSGRVTGTSLATSTLTGLVAGPLLEGSLQLGMNGFQAELQLQPRPWLPAGLPASDLHLSLSASPDLRWQAKVTGRADLRGLPLQLQVSLDGQALQYQGAGQLRYGDQHADLTTSGRGGDVELVVKFDQAQLAPLSTLLPVPVTGHASGELHFETTSLGGWAGRVAAQGAVADRPFDLTLARPDAGPKQAFTLSGMVAGIRVQVSPVQGEARAYDYHAETPDLALAGRLLLEDGLQLEGAGTFRAQPLSLSASFHPGAREGAWQTTWGEASFEGHLKPDGDDTAITGRLHAPSAGPLSRELDVTTEMRLTGGRLEVGSLRAHSGPADLQVSGRAWPQPELAGSLDLEGWLAQPLAVQLEATASGYLLALQQNDWKASGALDGNFRPLEVTSAGELRLLSSFRPSLTGRLQWDHATGFSGQSVLRVGSEAGVSATLNLVGEGALAIKGPISYRGTSLANLDLTLGASPWQDKALGGHLDVDIPVSDLLAAWPAEPLMLHGALEASGSLARPSFAGAVRLAGTLVATGELHASPKGASLTLDAPGLHLQGNLDRAGWRLDANAVAMDIADLLPQVAQPTISAVLHASQRWGGPLVADASSIALRSSRSDISGELRWAGQLSGSLRVNANLADVRVGGNEYRGTLTGRLAATGAGLSGQLEATALGLQDSPWALSGSIALAGDPASPTLDLELRGQGHAQGRLQASFAPAHHDLSFHSDLTIGPFQSDASISIAAGRSQARGKLAWGDFRVQVADGDQQGVILLRGFGRLAGWRAKLEPSRSRLSVAGSLQTLHPTISGLVALDWQWMEGIVGLSGQVSELQLGTLRLGKVAVAGQDHGATAIRVWGQALDARVSAAERGSWQLDRLEVPLTKDVTLQASGAGTLSELQLDAQLSAALPTQTVVLPFQLRYQQGVWRLLSDSELLSGHVLADLSHHDNAGWSGTLRLHQVSWHGLRINADTTAGGALVAPTLSGTLEAAWGQASLMAKLAADRHGATLDGKLDAPLLTRPLQVRGRLGSGASLTLQRAGGRGLVIAAGSDGGLVARGQLEVPAGPLSLRARPAEGGGVDLQLHLPPTGLAVGMTVPAKNLTTWLTAQLQGGLVLDGREATEGRVVVHFGATPALEVRDIRWSSEAGTLSLAGQVERQDAWLGNLVGAWQGSPATSGRTGVRTWPAGLKYLPFSLTLRRTSLRLDANSDALQVAASFDPRTLAFSMQGELKLDEGSTSLELTYKPSVGPSGTLRTEALPLMTAHGARSGPMTLTADIELEPDKVSGHATLASAGGRIEAEGNAGWARLLPATWRERFLPQAGSGLDAELRVATFDLANLPWVARRLPHLEAVVSGSAQLHADGIVGQLVAPDLRVEDSPLPSRLEFNGTPAALDVRATLADSRVDMSLQGGRVTGLADLQQFPLQVAAEAVVGASGVRALATGSVRFDLPLGAPGQGSVRAATQRIRLERNGVVSEGNVAFDYQAGSLVIERAEFTGAGSWTAQGRLTRERLDFSLSARDANFTPLLSLVPRLAELKVGAEGSMSLSLQGTPQEPLVSFESPDLELQLAGGHYLLEPLKLSLRGDVLKLSGELSGLSPIRGQLELHGGGRLQLRPWLAQDLQVQFSGQADIPPIGAIEGIRGTVRADPEAGWRLESSARLGQDFRLSGDLAPLNLQLTGQGLDIHAPRYFLTSSVTDVDLRLRYESAFLISGVVDVRQAMLSAAARGASPAPATAESARRPDWPTGKNPLYRDILFDKVRIRAPQEVRFEAGFGSAELSSDLTLTGSAAVPLLDGEVRALRGSVAFSGRDFSIDSAVASFDPSQGIYPTLAVQASTSYDKTDVLQGRNAGEVEFVAPRGSSSFEVFLDLTGEFRSEGVGPKQPDLTPELSSNALIQVQSEAAVSAGGPRPLDEQELVSLLALGRLDLDGDLLSETGLAGSVAQSALDTAVDVFILSELQEALGEALGVDLLQIRTSPLSSLLAGEGDFGVSLQLGGYLNEDVFATYRIGRFTGAGQDYAFTNEFNLRYDLAPVSFSLQGGVNFLNDTFTPVPEFGVSVDYGVTPFINLGANLDLSSIRQSFGIGLNIRW